MGWGQAEAATRTVAELAAAYAADSAQLGAGVVTMRGVADRLDRTRDRLDEAAEDESLATWLSELHDAADLHVRRFHARAEDLAFRLRGGAAAVEAAIRVIDRTRRSLADLLARYTAWVPGRIAAIEAAGFAPYRWLLTAGLANETTALLHQAHVLDLLAASRLSDLTTTLLRASQESPAPSWLEAHAADLQSLVAGGGVGLATELLCLSTPVNAVACTVAAGGLGALTGHAAHPDADHSAAATGVSTAAGAVAGPILAKGASLAAPHLLRAGKGALDWTRQASEELWGRADDALLQHLQPVARPVHYAHDLMGGGEVRYQILGAGQGSDTTVQVRVLDDLFGDTTRGWLKPSVGEADFGEAGVTPGTGAYRSMAVQEVDRLLGFETVAETRLISTDAGPATLQAHVPRALHDVTDYPRLASQRMAIVDYITGQGDRLLRNWGTDTLGHPVAFDSGMSFTHPMNVGATISSNFVGEWFQKPLERELVEHVAQLDRQQLRYQLADLGLSSGEIRGALARAHEIATTGMITGDSWPGAMIAGSDYFAFVLKGRR